MGRNVCSAVVQEVFWPRYFGAVTRAKAAARQSEDGLGGEGMVMVPSAAAAPTPTGASRPPAACWRLYLQTLTTEQLWYIYTGV